ncbi:MAG: leucine-rich repeat protein, partial [Prevotella sp.]|nr:leucine-rich repeat protein [Prevotella sp.]
MKRTLLFLACVLTSITMLAQDDLTVGDMQNSGCLLRARGENEPLPTIVLTKEGNILSVQLLNYESNCATSDFNVTSTVSGGSDSEPYSVNINVVPYLPDGEAMDCICPYNVSFTVREVEASSFHLSCWWYEGQVTLEEGKPLVLEDIWEEVTIDGMKYTLRKAMDRAMLVDGSSQKGEVRIPSELNYEGKDYSVTSLGKSAFTENMNLTKVFIPQTIMNMDLSNDVGFYSNPFYGCTALQSIEVDEGNPAVCSVDGVLFNKEKTKLLSYPAGVPQSSYTVPESVTWIEPLAFSYSQHLRKVTLTDNVTALGYSAFYDCKSLEEVRLPSGLEILADHLFENCLRLKSVTIPQGVTYIGLKTFYGCTSLTSVTMPESVTSTNYSVFEGCTSLESVTLSPNLERIMNNMFTNCSSLKEIIIPNCVTMVGSDAFKNCSALTSLDLPKNINRLGSSIFAGCKLKSLYIRGVIDSHWMSPSIFTDMDTQTMLYVQPSEVEKFQTIYKGPVYPLSQMSNDVMINETIFPDELFRKWLSRQEYGKDGILTEEEIAGVTFMNLFPQNLIAVGHIKSLKGIEYFTAVTKIVCSMNELTELDLSKNTALTWLECYGNHLTKLDLSKNTELTILDCSGNELTALNVSCCNKLTELNCIMNELTELDLSKNNALTRLECSGNHLTELDLSKNTALTTLDCNGNELTALNVLDCASLSSLRCDNNRLTQLDMSENTELSSLVCNNNQLTQLDVSKNTELTELRCHENQLTALDLSKNKKLKTLRTYHNPINGVAMDALIESLPKVSRGGWSCVLNKDEEGAPTTTQVAAAKKKGWTSYYWDEAAKSWKEYAGTEAPQMTYRPMIEDDKVWTVRLIPSWADPDEEQTEKYFEYYYFDGDTIINGQTAKRMLYDRIGSNWDKSGEYIGAWYEQDKKVYYASKGKQQFELLYDFTLSTGDIIQSEDRVLQVTKMSSGIPGFKGTYYDLKYEYQTSIVERWLEGVGSQYYPWLNLCTRWAGAPVALLACKAGDEIIYYNSEEDDPFSMGAKKRFDFTHTIKEKPRTRSEAEEQPLYGEYNDQQLGINLDPLDEAYMVRITDKSDNVVYEKAINAGNIVGL